MPRCHTCTVQSLFVASAGGHLEELRLISEHLPGGPREITWVTWETPQSRALLDGERRIFIEPTPSHSPAGTTKSMLAARAIVDPARFDEVVSTGALPAVPFMAVARARRIPCYYYESAARVAGPSLTGRLVELLPGVHRYCQYPDWAVRRPGSGIGNALTGGLGPRWEYAGSVFDGYEPGPVARRHLRRAVVMLGSSSFGFRRLVVAALQALPSSCEVTWQTGSTDVSGLPIDATPMMDPSELAVAVETADVVISHAGVGSALLAFRYGHCPILVARRSAFHEHTDDHQLALARDLGERGLAIACDADGLVRRAVDLAVSRTVAVAGAPGPISEAEPELVLAGSAAWRRHGAA